MSRDKIQLVKKESVEKAISEQGCAGRVRTLGTVTSYSLHNVHSSSCSRWTSYWQDSRQLGDLECIQFQVHFFIKGSGFPPGRGRARDMTQRENCRKFPINPGSVHHHQKTSLASYLSLQRLSSSFSAPELGSQGGPRGQPSLSWRCFCPSLPLTPTRPPRPLCPLPRSPVPEIPRPLPHRSSDEPGEASGRQSRRGGEAGARLRRAGGASWRCSARAAHNHSDTDTRPDP